ncbi:Nucleoside diphosphate kinase II, chloroplastic [Coccomyxa viridis]|uniref:Nucleoside diphosphate kinase n=1 Tax=Coccomyxa viridis TaxID=1274662 RepID=A0AAV1IAI5_9CHLO|nr:Nucleoside diphosphate kinase II, chloroplastic [Coccomyxa viridis]
MRVTQQSAVVSLPVLSHHCAGHRRHGTNTSASCYRKLSVRKEQHQNRIHMLRSSTYACRSRVHSGCVRAEISYIMVKPDGVQRGLVGEIVGRFERKGFTLRGLKLFTPGKELAEEHYKDLSQKPFFKDLVDYITSGPVVAMVWEGDGVVKSARKLIGSTNPLEAEPGTIRGDLAVQTGRNVVHGSDSPENGERETALWFGSGSVEQWQPALAPWLRE